MCAIQGGCLGGGVDLICSADIRLATNDAFFSIRETKIGMVADVGTFPRIVKLLPEGIVKELAFTGRNFSAQEAKDYGFVNRLYDSHEALIEGALEIAKEIASNSPAAVFGCKKVIDFSRDHTIDEGLEWINMWNASMLSQSELMEGFRSYKALGKKVGKDIGKNKATFVSKLGLDNSKKKAIELVSEACEAISDFKDRSRNLCQIAKFIVSRQF